MDNYIVVMSDDGTFEGVREGVHIAKISDEEAVALDDGTEPRNLGDNENCRDWEDIPKIEITDLLKDYLERGGTIPA